MSYKQYNYYKRTPDRRTGSMMIEGTDRATERTGPHSSSFFKVVYTVRYASCTHSKTDGAALRLFAMMIVDDRNR